MADWAQEANSYRPGTAAASTAGGSGGNEMGDRSTLVQTELKKIYKKAVLPVEKRFRYDYFYESPFLSDVEFDCKCTVHRSFQERGRMLGWSWRARIF